jgi:hypothetical protein
MMYWKTSRLMTLLACAGLFACSDGSGPPTGARIAFSMGTRGTSATALRNPVDDGTRMLEITSVKVVLRKVEFKREEDESCDDDSNPPVAPSVNGQHDESDPNNGGHGDDGENDGADGDEDACESITVGPMLVTLPLDPGVKLAFNAILDPGTYDEVRVKVHVPEPGNPIDDAFLATPEGQGVDYSVIVEGKYFADKNLPDFQPFTFKSHLSANQEIHLNPPLVIEPGSTGFEVSVTVDVDSWFKDDAGNLIDPRTADENVVNQNIRNSFRAFRDEDHDGHDDDGSDDD